MPAARLAAIVVLALGALAAAAWAAAGDTQLASRANGLSGAAANQDATLGGISGDGRFVVFHTLATNLSGGLPDVMDVFVRDTAGGGTFLASRGEDSVLANGNSSDADISPDGGFVVFNSLSNNLDPGDSSTDPDVYVRDMTGGGVTLVSRTSGIIGPKANGISSSGDISANGRFVVFASLATNLPDDTDPESDIFVRDLQTNTTSLVSRASTATGAKGNAASSAPSISADGRFVTFTTVADNLDSDESDSDTLNDVYVRDLQSFTTTLVSRIGSDGPKGNGPSFAGRIARGGRFVSFLSGATNLGGPESGGIYVRDLEAATTTLASRSTTGAPAAGGVSFSSISDSGRFVVFTGGGSSVHPDDPDTFADVFLRDLQAGTTTLLSRASGAGVKGNNNSGSEGGPLIAPTGASVAFGSRATNLHPDDTDSELHVFTRELGQPAQPPPPPPPPPPPAGPPPPPPPVEPPLSRPVAGRSELVQVVSGIILVRQRGSRRFVRVRADTLIRDGSEIDARRGVLRLIVAAVRDGSRTSSALVSRGRAIVDQNRAARPLTTLRLSGPLTSGRRASAAQRRKKRRRGSRSLFTETEGGRFRTRGSYGAATASGTAWLTTDRATTTKVTVFDGRVRVRDLVRRRTVTVRAPNSYTARRNARRR